MESFRAISSNVEPIKEDQDDVKPIEIKAPQNTSAIIFDTVEEFTRFFRANESLFKTQDGSHFLSANRLNRSYKVPGYRISITNRKKDNESLSLHKDYYRGADLGVDKLISPDIIDNILARLDHIEEFLSSMTEPAALAGDACSPGRACHPLGRAAEPGNVRRSRLSR